MADGVGVGVTDALDSPGITGKSQSPVLMKSVLNNIAKTIATIIDTTQLEIRESPGKGAKRLRLVACCCAAAVRNADRPGLNP